jgi:hypothetical protein
MRGAGAQIVKSGQFAGESACGRVIEEGRAASNSPH